MPDRPTITVHAPAKLNLALSVGPPDASGMHPICSWMITVDLVDELHIKRLEDDRLSRYAILWHPEARRQHEIDWSITKDLAVRAHRALETRSGRRLPVQLKVEKRIPVGGGLGGGSSNAAAMLHAVNELFELGLGLDELMDIGATIGSDVPFLLGGGSAVVSGIGDQLEPTPVSDAVHAVVVLPDAACPTGAVYEAFDTLGDAMLRPQAVATLCRTGAPAADALFNDLTPAALRIAPELDDLLTTLATLAERPSHLSGSGSSLFVICDDPLHADALAAAVEERMAMPAVAVRSLEVTHAGAA